MRIKKKDEKQRTLDSIYNFFSLFFKVCCEKCGDYIIFERVFLFKPKFDASYVVDFNKSDKNPVHFRKYPRRIYFCKTCFPNKSDILDVVSYAI